MSRRHQKKSESPDLKFYETEDESTPLISKTILPRFERPSTTKFLVWTLICASPCLLFIMEFSAMGFGHTNMILSRNSDLTSPVITSLVIFTLLLYLLDITYWNSAMGNIIRALCITVICCGIFVVIFLKQSSYPTGPLCAFIIGTSLWLVGIKFTSYRNVTVKDYVGWLSVPLLFVSFLTIAIWITWAALDNEWDDYTKLKYSSNLGCIPDFSAFPECRNSTLYEASGVEETCFGVDSSHKITFSSECNSYCLHVYNKCPHAFFLWANPFLAGIGLSLLSVSCAFLNSQNTDPLDNGMHLFCKIYTVLLFMLWCAASLAGAGDGLATPFVAYTVASLIAVGILLIVTFGRFSHNEEWVQMMEKLHSQYEGYMDVLRSLVVISCAPIIGVYLVLSMVNQLMRRMACFPCLKKCKDGEKKCHSHWTFWLTEKTREQVHDFNTWNHCKIYRFAIYWGMGFMTMQVLVQQFTVAFLSWLFRNTQEMSIVAVSGVIAVAGVILFVLPPVPGGAIYIPIGMLLVPTTKDSFGLVGSICYCVVLSLFIKLAGCAMQQKVIGQSLSKFVKTRQLVGINSRLVRTMRLVLSEPGMSMAKICILVGGPDWPTSVLCGIMRLPLLPNLLGTMPIIIIIIPMVLTGTLTYLSKFDTSEVPWAGTACAFMVVITTISQFGSMMLAAHYIDKTMNLRKKEIDAIPLDMDVIQADKTDQSIQEAYLVATRWEKLPFMTKMALRTSLISMILCCYTVQIFHTYCFVEYDMTASVFQDDDETEFAVMKPLGLVVVHVFILSCVLLFIFLWWANRTAKLHIKDVKKNETQERFFFGETLHIGGKSADTCTSLAFLEPESDTYSVTSRTQYGSVA